MPAGQAQKEFYLNGALSSLDLLAHTSVSGVSDTPPASPVEGEAWLVSANAQGDWVGYVDKIAQFSSGAWKFFEPVLGMRIFDSGNGKFMHFDGAWKAATTTSSPQGGMVIDVEARAIIDELIIALQDAGIFART